MTQIVGLDAIGVDRVLDLMGEQSAWYLRLVEAHEGVSDEQVLGHVRQFFHFFSNMAQAEVA